MPERKSSRRRAKERAESRRQKEITRRRFLQIGGLGFVAALAAIAGHEIIRTNNERELENALQDFRGQLEIPEYSLNEEELSRFANEKWFEPIFVNIPEAYFDTNNPNRNAYLDQAIGTMLNGLVDDMSVSAHPAFRETANVIKTFASDPNDQVIEHWSIVRLIDRLGLFEEGGHPVFASGAGLLEDRTWYFRLAANASLLTPELVGDTATDLQIKGTWALALVHEISGHYNLATAMFDYLDNTGMSDGQMLEIIRNDSYQEPFSYAVQASAILPVRGLLGTERIPLGFSDLASEWSRLQAGGWQSQEWAEYVADNF